MTTHLSHASSSHGLEPSDRERVRAQLEAQRKFRADVFAYLVVNLLLIGAWLVTGAGYFWPGWVLAGWGALLLLDGWDAAPGGDPSPTRTSTSSCASHAVEPCFVTPATPLAQAALMLDRESSDEMRLIDRV